ncbi:hypothetical protein [Microvirgula aerodenitrificans]|uniref:hypothetical protein n=1 Tax=Microvirgula aerodenitrificans TaxID=57480 RepID=UPI00248DB8B1|nr:hypothetical protein [Microvirgula aerodenitrificans]
MRYRKLDANGDYTFGSGQADFVRNEPSVVRQAVLTRLALWTGEWFIALKDGTPYRPDVLGKYTRETYDAAIQRRILGTAGVTQIAQYASEYDGNTRTLTVSATIDTAYGQITINKAM